MYLVFWFFITDCLDKMTNQEVFRKSFCCMWLFRKRKTSFVFTHSALRCEGMWSGGTWWSAESLGVRKDGPSHRGHPDEPPLQSLSHHLHGAHGTEARRFSSSGRDSADPLFQISFCGLGWIRAHPQNRQHWWTAQGEHSDQQWTSGSWKCHWSTWGPQKKRHTHPIQGFQNHQVIVNFFKNADDYSIISRRSSPND